MSPYSRHSDGLFIYVIGSEERDLIMLEVDSEFTL